VKYLPLLLVSAALLAVVVLMSGEVDRGKQVLRNIVLAIVVLTGLAILFGLVVRPLLER
jgi:hypothetical protein